MPLTFEDNQILRRSYYDFEEYADAYTRNQWDIDIAQLDRGEFEANLVTLSLGPFRINHGRMNRSCLVRGQTHAGVSTFGFPVAMESSGSWMCNPIRPDAVQNWAENREYEAVSPRGFENISCSVLPNYSEIATDYEEIVSCFLRPDVNVSINCGWKIKGRIISEFFRLLNQFQQNPEYLENQSCISDCSEGIIELLGQIDLSKNDPVKISRGNSRNAVVARATEYLDFKQDEPVTVRELRQHANASRSTLERAFRDKYGVMPKAYLTAHRLNGVRKMLKAPDSSACRISEIAGRWGFWHMSQFAADYRDQFGELPSETLTRVLGTRPVKRPKPKIP